MAMAHDGNLEWGVIAPITLLGVAFAVLVTPLTASVLSSVNDRDAGLASGVNNTAARAAQMLGVALAAGLAGFENGWRATLTIAAAASVTGALCMIVVPRKAAPD
jgi:predicted MFS family arabinose efflux permease